MPNYFIHCYFPLLVNQTNASPKLRFAVLVAIVYYCVAVPSVEANLGILSIKRELPA